MKWTSIVYEFTSAYVCEIDIDFFLKKSVYIHSASLYLYGCLFLFDLKVPEDRVLACAVFSHARVIPATKIGKISQKDPLWFR